MSSPLGTSGRQMSASANKPNPSTSNAASSSPSRPIILVPRTSPDRFSGQAAFHVGHLPPSAYQNYPQIETTGPTPVTADQKRQVMENYTKAVQLQEAQMEGRAPNASQFHHVTSNVLSEPSSFLGGRQNAERAEFRYKEIHPNEFNRQRYQNQNPNEDEVSFFVYSPVTDISGPSGVVRVVSMALQNKREEKFALVQMEDNQPITAELSIDFYDDDEVKLNGVPILEGPALTDLQKRRLCSWVHTQATLLAFPWTVSQDQSAHRYQRKPLALRQVLPWNDETEESYEMRQQVFQNVSRAILSAEIGASIHEIENVPFDCHPLFCHWLREFLRVPTGLEAVSDYLRHDCTTKKEAALKVKVIQGLSMLLMQGDYVLINQMVIGWRDLERSSKNSKNFDLLTFITDVAQQVSESDKPCLDLSYIQEVIDAYALSDDQPQAVVLCTILAANMGIVIPSSIPFRQLVDRLDQVIPTVLRMTQTGLLRNIPTCGLEGARQAVYQLVLSEKEGSYLDGTMIAHEVDRIVEALEANKLRNDLLKDFTGSPTYNQSQEKQRILCPYLISNLLVRTIHHSRRGNTRHHIQLADFLTRNLPKCRAAFGKEESNIHEIFDRTLSVMEVSLENPERSRAIKSLFAGVEFHGCDVPSELPPMSPI